MTQPDQSESDPTMVTAADYETYVRPYIMALEAENERLRLQVLALENAGMETAARLGEAEARLAFDEEER